MSKHPTAPPSVRLRISWFRLVYFSTLLCSGTVCLSGCATFQSWGTDPVTAAAPSTSTPPRGMISVSIQSDGQQPRKAEYPLDASTENVQAALVKSGALKKFRRVKIMLIRSLPNGRRHKMDVSYDPGTKAVPLEYDYALRPGDHVIVIEDPTSALDEMFESASIPLGVFGRR